MTLWLRDVRWRCQWRGGTFVPPRASASPDQSLHPENLQQRRLESDRGCPEGEGEVTNSRCARERMSGAVISLAVLLSGCPTTRLVELSNLPYACVSFSRL